MNKVIINGAAAVMLAVAGLPAFGEVKLASPFGDRMVLQRERAVPVWGTAAPGESVTVTFGDQCVSTRAGANGDWRVELKPMSACAEPRDLVAAGGSGRKVLRDVLVGEVWFASGQSNMECPIWGGNPRYRDGKGSMMIAMTREPQVRFVKMARALSVQPKRDAAVVWRKFLPGSFAEKGVELSAVAFYYALELHNALDIPVGIVDASWGGTIIDAWTPRSAYAKHPELGDVADFPVTDKPSAAMRRGVLAGASPHQPTVLWNGMVATWAGYACRGFIWYQGCSNVSEASRYCDKMHALYDGWSGEFGNPDLKLYFVLLAPFQRNWFDIQKGQLKFAAEERNAAITVIADHGNMADIHPNEKEIVAKRLALHALRRDYGFGGIEDESPTLKSWSIEGGDVTLEFDHAKSLYVYNPDHSPKCGFRIRALGGKELPADIVKNAGNRLVIRAKDVTNDIVRVTYLKDPPHFGALYSHAALPAAPFDIDLTERYLPKLDASAKKPDLGGARKVYEIDLPERPSFGGKAPKYGLDAAASAGSFSRVGYLYELERKTGGTEWVYTEFDAPTNDVRCLGVPSQKGGFAWLGRVANLTVVSNVEGVEARTGYDGGSIEFHSENYLPATSAADLGGDGMLRDFNDTVVIVPNGPGYGSMQVHDWKAGRTIWAFNNFNGGKVADCGIGQNRLGEQPDWTFMANADQYKTRRLTVFVR